MPYDERFVAPMRMELTQIGFEELRTAEEVDEKVKNSKGTLLVVINSICGCAAGMCRPGVALSLRNEAKPEHLATVFAGQDLEATERLRSYIPFPPSSPSIALFVDGELKWFLPRHEIEGRFSEDVASALVTAYDTYCSQNTVAD